MADDSGLVVDALNGDPGIRSARYAGTQATDADNNARLIRALSGVPQERRAARFVCAIALADTDGVLAAAQGTVEGRIIDEPRGSNGFGYDPHFFLPQLGRTMAELTLEQKSAISHRGAALRKLRADIDDLLKSS